MSVYPLYLVLGKDGSIGAYAREDVLKINLVENFKAGEPARAVWALNRHLMTVTYERTSVYDEWVQSALAIELSKREHDVIINALNYAKNEWGMFDGDMLERDAELMALADDADSLEARLRVVNGER